MNRNLKSKSVLLYELTFLLGFALAELRYGIRGDDMMRIKYVPLRSSLIWYFYGEFYTSTFHSETIFRNIFRTEVTKKDEMWIIEDTCCSPERTAFESRSLGSNWTHILFMMMTMMIIMTMIEMSMTTATMTAVLPPPLNYIFFTGNVNLHGTGQCDSYCQLFKTMHLCECVFALLS